MKSSFNMYINKDMIEGEGGGCKLKGTFLIHECCTNVMVFLSFLGLYLFL